MIKNWRENSGNHVDANYAVTNQSNRAFFPTNQVEGNSLEISYVLYLRTRRCARANDAKIVHSAILRNHLKPKVKS